MKQFAISINKYPFRDFVNELTQTVLSEQLRHLKKWNIYSNTHMLSRGECMVSALFG